MFYLVGAQWENRVDLTMSVRIEKQCCVVQISGGEISYLNNMISC